MEKAPHKETKVPGIVAALRNRIWNGSLRPGEQLHQQALAETLGVSLIPLREALRVMEADGLVEFTPHKGVRVATVTSEEVYAWSLECKAILHVVLPLAIPHLDAAAFARLHVLARREDPTLTPLENIQEFFSLTCKPCGSPRILHIVDQLLSRFGRYLPVGGNALWLKLRDAPPTQEDLVNLCESGDVPKAIEAFEAYLMPWVLGFRAMLDENAGEAPGA